MFLRVFAQIFAEIIAVNQCAIYLAFIYKIYFIRTITLFTISIAVVMLSSSP
jgi:hypothetical protein